MGADPTFEANDPSSRQRNSWYCLTIVPRASASHQWALLMSVAGACAGAPTYGPCRSGLSSDDLCKPYDVADVWAGIMVTGSAGLAAWLPEMKRLAVLTGAGISTDSGIPDFRGPQGLWTRNPGAQQMSTYQAYVSDPALRRRSWRARREPPAWAAEPNAAHLALAGLASAIDTWVITQNIDGLHQKAGTPAER